MLFHFYVIYPFLNKSWQQHLTKHQLYGHLPPITKTIQVRRTRHTGHCWRSRDKLISDVLLWTPTYGLAKAGRPAQTDKQHLCEDMGCSSKDLLEAMNDREKWRERVRDIHASGTIWWWWPLSYVLFIPIFCSSMVLLLLHPVVGLFPCIPHFLVGRIFFCYLGIFCFACIAWVCLHIFLLFFFFQCLLIHLYKLYHETLLFCFGLFILACFSFLSVFACCHSFFNCTSSLISHKNFVFLFRFPRRTQFLSSTCFAPA